MPRRIVNIVTGRSLTIPQVIRWIKKRWGFDVRRVRRTIDGKRVTRYQVWHGAAGFEDQPSIIAAWALCRSLLKWWRTPAFQRRAAKFLANARKGGAR